MHNEDENVTLHGNLYDLDITKQLENILEEPYAINQAEMTLRLEDVLRENFYDPCVLMLKVESDSGSSTVESAEQDVFECYSPKDETSPINENAQKALLRFQNGILIHLFREQRRQARVLFLENCDTQLRLLRLNATKKEKSKVISIAQLSTVYFIPSVGDSITSTDHLLLRFDTGNTLELCAVESQLTNELGYFLMSKLQ